MNPDADIQIQNIVFHADPKGPEEDFTKIPCIDRNDISHPCSNNRLEITPQTASSANSSSAGKNRLV